MKVKSITTVLASLAVGAALVTGASFTTAAAADKPAKMSIVVGSDTTFPPFETLVDGKPTGFDIDMIKGIAKLENLDVTFKSMSFNGIIPSLQAGTLDAAVAGITIKKSRMANVDFSDAYYLSGLSILVKKDSPIKGFDDLKGHVVATRKATSSVSYLLDHGFPADHIKQYQNIDAAYQALMTGGADAVIFDNPVNLTFISKHKDAVHTVGPLLTGEYYGIAVAQGKTKLLKRINDGLAKMMKNGEYKKLFDKYFDGDLSGAVKPGLKPAKVAVKD